MSKEIIVNELENGAMKVEESNHTNGNGKTIVNPSAPALQVLIVDSHEPEEFAETFRQEKGIYIVVKELESGDYAFSNIGIERKTLRDFYNSITQGDKRIWQQMFNLKRCFERPMLVIERWDDSFMVDSYKNRTVLSTMGRIAMMGITVIVLPGKAHDWKTFVDFVAYMFFASDKKTPSLKPVPKKSHQETVMDAREDAMCMIPGIGRKTAKEILGRTHTIKGVTTISLEELSKWIGPSKAKMVKAVLEGSEEELKTEDPKQ